MFLIRLAPVLPYDSARTVLQALPGSFQKQAEKYTNGSAFCQSVTAWNCLKDLLEENGLEADEVIVNKTGKPVFKNSSLFFSLSHDPKLAGALISDVPCGLDIQSKREISFRTMKHVLNGHELECVKSHPDLAWKIFSAREAAFKAHNGSGCFKDTDIHGVRQEVFGDVCVSWHLDYEKDSNHR